MSIVPSTDDDTDDSHSEQLENLGTESVVAELEGKFIPGTAIGGVEEAYLLYSQYALCVGFGVRRGRQLWFTGSPDVRRKDFYCSCRGFFRNHKHPVEVTRTYSRQHMRTGCGALLRIKRSFSKPWTVAKFVQHHNHELLSPDSTYMLRSARNLCHHKKVVMDALSAAGVGAARSFRFMEHQSGGVQHVGFTKVDAFNYADSSKQFSRVENGDARALMKFCIDKSNKEHAFYWSFKQDSNGRLMHIYFRDSRCLTDYEAFGDVLMLDTTYRTNKYDIMVAPFVGVNHHKQNILFGMGFLSSETTADFEWLFAAFLESMKDRQPTVMFTDQCQAMMTATERVFPNSCHRLCQWHINRNACSHFGALNARKDFFRDWRRCSNGVESVDEFENLWAHMRKKYALGDNKWFANMYNLRRKWASVFSQELFTCGMIATSRSEATNHSLKKKCESTNCLFEFVQCYERMKTEWRDRETASDVSNIGNPGRCASLNPLLRVASRTLTRAAYTMFEKQMVNILNYKIESETMVDGQCVIKVKVLNDQYDDDPCSDSGEDSGDCSDEESLKERNAGFANKVDDAEAWDDGDASSRRHYRTVHFDPVTHLSSCSCKLWEKLGILCRHILKVYNAKIITALPVGYLMPRWCKNAKLRLLEMNRKSTGETKFDGLDRLAYVNFFMRLAKEVADECQYVPTIRNASLKELTELRKSIFSMMESHRCSYDTGEQHASETMFDPMDLRDPPPSKRRESRANRETSHACKPTMNERGTKTKASKMRGANKDTYENSTPTTGSGAPMNSSQMNNSSFHSPSRGSYMGAHRSWDDHSKVTPSILHSPPLYESQYCKTECSSHLTHGDLAGNNEMETVCMAGTQQSLVTQSTDFIPVCIADAWKVTW